MGTALLGGGLRRRRLGSAAVCWAALASALPGCAPPLGDPPLERRSAGVVGGEPSPTSNDAVVFIRVEHGDRYSDCTATLIAPRVLITAKHCLAAIGAGEFLCSATGELLRDGTGAGVFGAVADPATLSVWLGASPSGDPSARGLQIFDSGAGDACRDDIALVVLDRELSAPGYLSVRREAVTQPGDRVTLIGYGSVDGDAPVRREVHDVRVLQVGALESAGSSITPRTLVVAGGTVCTGDSGGPALAHSDRALIGVYSRISGACESDESRNTFVLAAGFTKLIDAALSRFPMEAGAAGAAGAAGEGPAATMGEAGTTAAARTGGSVRDDALRCGAGRGASARITLLALVLAMAGLKRRRSWARAVRPHDASVSVRRLRGRAMP